MLTYPQGSIFDITSPWPHISSVSNLWEISEKRFPHVAIKKKRILKDTLHGRDREIARNKKDFNSLFSLS